MKSTKDDRRQKNKNKFMSIISVSNLNTANDSMYVNKTNNKRVHLLTKTISMGLMTATLAACNTIPPVDNTTIIAEPNILIDQPYTTLDKTTVSTNKYPNIAIHRWERYYQDENLKQLIHIALKENKDLEKALLAIKQSKTQFQISDNALIPRIGGNAGYTRSANNIADKNPHSSYSVGLAMSNYELDLWGRVASLKDKALQEYLATTAGKDAVQISLISGVAQTYVNLSYARAQYELAKSTVESREQSLYITQKRFEAGVDNKSPSLQAASSLESAKVAMYNAETNVLKLRNALELLIGMPIPAALEPESGVTTITTPKIFNTGLPSDLLHYRPDILQAEYNLKASGANIRAARAAYFPSISLTGRLGVSSANLNDLFNHNTALGWSFGPSISVPIFDAGQLDSQYQVSQIARDSALASYEKSIQTAFREVRDVLADRATLEKRLESQYKLQDNFNETYIIANARYKSGLSDYLSVLDAERSKFAAQQSILQLEQAKLISQIQLYQVLGGGVEIDAPEQLSATQENSELVEFISSKQTDIDRLNKNLTVTSTNIARSASDTRLATQQDYIDQQKHLDELNKKDIGLIKRMSDASDSDNKATQVKSQTQESVKSENSESGLTNESGSTVETNRVADLAKSSMQSPTVELNKLESNKKANTEQKSTDSPVDTVE